MYVGQGLNYVLPKTIQLNIDKRFEKPIVKSMMLLHLIWFDASVNLMVAKYSYCYWYFSLKLPLSTTYVTLW
jgi:hypothetical protein